LINLVVLGIDSAAPFRCLLPVVVKKAAKRLRPQDVFLTAPAPKAYRDAGRFLCRRSPSREKPPDGQLPR